MQVLTLCIFWNHVFSIPQILVTVVYEIMIFLHILHIDMIWWYLCIGGRDRAEPEA